MDELKPDAFVVPQLAVDVVCVHTGVARFEATLLCPGAMQTEGGRQPCQHVGKVLRELSAPSVPFSDVDVTQLLAGFKGGIVTNVNLAGIAKHSLCGRSNAVRTCPLKFGRCSGERRSSTLLSTDYPMVRCFLKLRFDMSTRQI